MKYAVVIEKGPTSYGAHVPDLPGCVAAAETRDEVCALINEAIELYVEALEEDGLPVPEPHSLRIGGNPRPRSERMAEHLGRKPPIRRDRRDPPTPSLRPHSWIPACAGKTVGSGRRPALERW